MTDRPSEQEVGGALACVQSNLRAPSAIYSHADTLAAFDVLRRALSSPAAPPTELDEQRIGEAFDAANQAHPDHGGVFFHPFAALGPCVREMFIDFARRVSCAPAAPEDNKIDFEILVDRAGRAICAEMMGQRGWEHASNSSRAHWKTLARIALAASRSPVVPGPAPEPPELMGQELIPVDLPEAFVGSMASGLYGKWPAQFARAAIARRVDAALNAAAPALGDGRAAVIEECAKRTAAMGARYRDYAAKSRHAGDWSTAIKEDAKAAAYEQVATELFAEARSLSVPVVAPAAPTETNDG